MLLPIRQLPWGHKVRLVRVHPGLIWHITGHAEHAQPSAGGNRQSDEGYPQIGRHLCAKVALKAIMGGKYFVVYGQEIP